MVAVIAGIAVAQLQGLLTDLRLEVPRMKAGELLEALG